MTRRRQPEAELFGQRLRQLRNDRGLTQVQLAEASGLIDTYISDMERGLKVPSLTTLLRLADALGCKVADLVTVFDQEPDLKRFLGFASESIGVSKSPIYACARRWITFKCGSIT